MASSSPADITADQQGQPDQRATTGALTPADIAAALQTLSAWREEQTALRKQFEFQDFAAAMRFVNTIATAAEVADHHPDIDIRYNKVAISLSTHSQGGITQKDVNLARQIEELAEAQP